jgi:hypothetical protein
MQLPYQASAPISTRNIPPIQSFRLESIGIPDGTFKQCAKDVPEARNTIAKTNARCTLQ